MITALVALTSLILGVGVATLVALTWIAFLFRNLLELLCAAFSTSCSPAEQSSDSPPATTEPHPYL